MNIIGNLKFSAFKRKKTDKWGDLYERTGLALRLLTIASLLLFTQVAGVPRSTRACCMDLEIQQHRSASHFALRAAWACAEPHDAKNKQVCQSCEVEMIKAPSTVPRVRRREPVAQENPSHQPSTLGLHTNFWSPACLPFRPLRPHSSACSPNCRAATSCFLAAVDLAYLWKPWILLVTVQAWPSNQFRSSQPPPAATLPSRPESPLHSAVTTSVASSVTPIHI